MDYQRLDPEVRAFIALSSEDPATGSSLAAQRAAYDAMCARLRAPRPRSITVADSTLNAGDAPVPVRRYAPPHADFGASIVYYHGGGFVFGGLDSHDDVCAELADGLSAEVVAVDYRLAPEHPHPASFDDALAAARSVGAEGAPIILAGDSVGGNLAAGVSLALRAAPDVALLGSVLIYPSLSGGAPLGLSATEHAAAPMLTVAENAWTVARHVGDADPAILRAQDPSFAPLVGLDGPLEGMTPSIALAVEVDPLRDEAAAWIERLSARGVSAAFEMHGGLPHGCLRARHRSLKARGFFESICAALRRIRNI